MQWATYPAWLPAGGIAGSVVPDIPHASYQTLMQGV